MTFRTLLHGRGSDAFQILPLRGILPPHSSSLFAVKLMPSHPIRYGAKALFMLNSNGSELVEVELSGFCGLPQLRIT